MPDNAYSQGKTHRRWKFLVGVVLAILLLSGCSASAPKSYRVGILNGFTAFSGIVDGFKAKMTELGYVEGQNIIYDLR